MKKITLVSAIFLSAGLVACGGGDPKSASAKPDNLFPDNYVPPSSSSSNSSSDSSTGSGIVNQAIPYHENFDGAINTRTFFSTGYKGLNTFSNQPFYFPAGGFLDEFGNPSPTATSWITADSNRKLRIGNGRLTLGQTRLEIGTTSADTSIPTWGEFDLSKSYKVSFCVVQVSTASASNFEVYVDNNTTGGNNSIYGAGNASRILQVATHTLVPGNRQEVLVPATAGGRLIGSSTSFFQFRVSSGGWAVIDDLVIEYAGEPHGFTLPSCVAEESIAPEPEAVLPPDAPLAPTFELANEQLRVSWESVARATSYIVAYNTVDSLEGATLIGNGEEKIAVTTTLITGLENGTSYYVFVKAVNSGGESAFGPSSVGIPEVPAVAPSTPTGLTVYGDDKRALITWVATEGAESYAIAVNTVNNTDTAEVTTGVTDTYKRLNGLVNNTPYYVFINAGNVVGNSDYTAAQTVTPAASPYIYEANFAVTKDLFFGIDSPAVQTLGVDSEIPMHFIAGGGSGITLEEGGIRLASGGRFTIGQIVAPNTEGVLVQAPTTSDDTSVNGMLDLSGYYKIVINVVSAPDNTGLFQVYLDNNTASGANSIHQTTAASRLINRTANTITDGEEIVFEMSADRRGTATSFIQLRTDSNMGAEGILISSVRIEEIDPPVGGSSSEASSSAPASSSSSSSSEAVSSSAPASSSSSSSSEQASSSVPASSSSAPSSVASSESSSSVSSTAGGGTSSDASSSAAAFNWVDSTMDIFGQDVATAPQGSSVVQNNGETVVLNATGGTMTQDSAFRAFFTNIPVSGEFVFTARLASVEAKSGTSFTGPGNSYGFGIMVIQDKPASVASYANVPAFATLNLFTSNGTPTFAGSRAHKVDSTTGNRSRSNVTDIKAGDYMRIEVFRDGGGVYRVRRLFSDDGVSYTQANSTAWGTNEGEDWFVGLYAAPGAEELVITFDNISLVPYVAP